MPEINIPTDITLGTSTSSYQIEGAVNRDGKGPSIWDEFTRRSGVIKDGSDGSRACGHYDRMEEDVDLIKGLGVDAYRFSVSWPRVLPEGRGRVNEPGLDFYDRLVDRLLARGVSPYLTLYHWDLPLALEQHGGWTNRETASWFADYAALLADRLGDRVKHWITLNEPLSTIAAGYVAGVHAPGYRNIRKAAHAIHVQMLGHGRAFDAIKARIPEAQVGIANSFSPVYPERRVDQRIARRISSVLNEVFMDPIYFGHYPRPLAPIIHLLNRQIRSSDWDVIQRTPDFLGVNHYSRLIARRTILPFVGFKLVRPVAENVVFTDIDWEVYPPGFGRILEWIRERYDNPPVIVTENGASFDEPVQERRIHDVRRMDYITQYLQQLVRAREAGSDIRGYFVWSLLDNFEWAYGYTQRFGLVHVDYTNLQRIPKDSYWMYRDICTKRSFSLE